MTDDLLPAIDPIDDKEGCSGSKAGGLRVGIKNRGAFDINRLTYVLEFGAGSF